MSQPYLDASFFLAVALAKTRLCVDQQDVS